MQNNNNSYIYHKGKKATRKYLKRKYYEDQVAHNHSGKDAQSVKQHEQDKAMLDSINQNLKALPWQK